MKNYGFYLSALSVLLLSFLPIASGAKNERAETREIQKSHTLLLNEISPWDSENVWVEILNPNEFAVELEGWTIEFLSGFTHAFPSGAGEIEPGGLHVYEIKGANTLNPDGDGCILSNPDGQSDAIIWGIPTDISAITLYIGTPINPVRGFIGENEKFHETGDVIFRLPIEWETDIASPVGSAHWVYRDIEAASRGLPNPPPPPVRFSPENNAIIASNFMLSVEGFTWTSQTTFQVAMDEEFTDIVIEETVEGWSLTVENLEGGTYFWRVRGYRDGPQPWTNHRMFTRTDFDIEDLIAEFIAGGKTNRIPDESAGDKRQSSKSKGGGGGADAWMTAYHEIPVVQDTQRKDTRMVCIDGCDMLGKYAWDSPQPINDYSDESHGYGNCAMASLKMMASAHGCSLSQDRIAYYMMEEAGAASYHATLKNQIGNPWEDLNHGTKGGLYFTDAPLLVSWLYNQSKSASKNVNYSDKVFFDDSSEMDSIAEFIADNRPVLRCIPGHANLIAGAGFIDIQGIGRMYFIKVYDTGNIGDISWLAIDSASSSNHGYTFPPTTGRITRNDEPEIWMDSDGDGLVDFDEIHRFHTDPHNEDTDGDWVRDKQDILGYVFTPEGLYLKGERDYDGDGKPKELDPDNDCPNDSSAPDGCEDWDLDGFLTPGSNETSNFNVSDDFDNINPDCYSGIMKVEIEVRQSDADYRLHYKYQELLIIEYGNLLADDYIHSHQITFDFNYYSEGGSFETREREEGLAKFDLTYEPSTSEYFARINSTCPDIQPTVEFTTPWLYTFYVSTIPFKWFGNDEVWPLGQAQNVNGGSVVRGKIEEPNSVWSWEIWIEPPG